jgi:hypothetical protein
MEMETKMETKAIFLWMLMMFWLVLFIDNVFIVDEKERAMMVIV